MQSGRIQKALEDFTVAISKPLRLRVPPVVKLTCALQLPLHCLRVLSLHSHFLPARKDGTRHMRCKLHMHGTRAFDEQLIS
jgi:hypothetical protein